MAGELDDLVVVVGGDISPLQQALAGIPEAAAGVTTAAASAFEGIDQAVQKTVQATQAIPGAFNAASDSAAKFGSAAQEIVDAQTKADAALIEAQNALKEIQAAYESGAVSAQTLSRAQVELASAVSDANPKIQESDDQLKKLAGSLTALAGAIAIFQGVTSAIQDSLEAFGQLQKAQIALTALTGSASTAAGELEKLKAFSLSDALSFPSVVQAEQRMIALQIPLSQIPTLLQSAANSSAAMNSDFGTAVNMLDRFIAGGTILARSVASLGISMDDLAKAMGTTTAAATATFKSLDQSDRVEVLNIALSKLRGTSEATAQGLEGQWHNVQTNMLFAMQEVGKALAPLAEQFIGLANAVIPVITSMAHGFEALPMPVQEFVGVVGGLTLVLGPAALAVGTLTKAFAAMGALEGINDLLRANAVATTEAGAAAATAETKLLTAGTAMRALGAATVIAAAAFAGWEIGKWLNDLEQTNSKLHTVLEVFRALVDQMVPGAQQIKDALNTVTVTADAAALAYINQAAKVDGLTISQRALTKEYEQQQIALNSATDKLREAEDLKARGLISDGQLAAAQKAVNDALYAMNPAAQAAAEAAKKLEDSINALVTHSETLLSHIPTTFTAFQQSIADGGKSIKSTLSEVDTDIQKMIDKMNELGGATPAMLKAFGDLKQAQDNLKALANEEAWIKIQDQILALKDKMDTAGGATEAMLKEFSKLEDAKQKIEDLANANGWALFTHNITDAQGKLLNFVGPIKQSGDAIEVWVDGVKKASDVLVTATAGIVDATGHIPALTGVTIDYGTATDAAERGLREFSGDIVALPPAANAAATGIQVLTGSTNANAAASKHAADAQTALGTVFRTTADQAKIATDAAEGQARALQNVAEAATKAANSMEAALKASNELSQSFKVTGFGGGPGGNESPGGTVGLKPGDVVTQRGEAGQIISQNTVPGGLQAYIDWYNSLFVTIPQFHKLGESAGTASTAVANLGAAATQNASSLISAATGIANAITAGTAGARDAAQKAVDQATAAYNVIAAAYQTGQATADQMRTAQDALNAALAEFTALGGGMSLLSDAVSAVTGQLTSTDLGNGLSAIDVAVTGIGAATTGLANTATAAAATISTAATSITDATAAAVNGINSVVETITPTIVAAATVVSGISTLVEAVVPAVQAAAAIVMGANSTTLLGPTAPTQLGPGGEHLAGPSSTNNLPSVDFGPAVSFMRNAPNVTPTAASGVGLPNANPFAFSGGQGNGAPATVNMNINITGGGGAAVARDIVSTLQSMGVKVV